MNSTLNGTNGIIIGSLRLGLECSAVPASCFPRPFEKKKKKKSHNISGESDDDKEARTKRALGGQNLDGDRFGRRRQNVCHCGNRAKARMFVRNVRHLIHQTASLVPHLANSRGQMLF
jgi:hypothetical protein